MTTNTRQNMTNSIKEIVVPYLREHGFKGSFPHFRRQHEDYIDLITFQFNRYGGSFVVELAICPADGVTTSWGEEIPPNKVTAHDVSERHRLSENENDPAFDWFVYEEAKSKEDYDIVATKVKNLLRISDVNWIKNLF